MPATLSYTYPNATKPSMTVPLQDNAPSFRIGKATKLVGLDGREISGIPDQFSVQRNGAEWLLTNLAVSNFTYSHEGDNGCCILIPKRSNASLKSGESINIKFCTLGGVEHKFALIIAGEAESKKRPIKSEDTETEDDEPEPKKQAMGAAAAAASSADGSVSPILESGVAAKVLKSADGSRPKVSFAADTSSTASTKSRAEFLRRKHENSEARMDGAAGGGIMETETQPMDPDSPSEDEEMSGGGCGGCETQAFGDEPDYDPTAAAAAAEADAKRAAEVKAKRIAAKTLQACILRRNAVCGVIEITKDVGPFIANDKGLKAGMTVKIHDDKEVDFGRLPDNVVVTPLSDLYSKHILTIKPKYSKAGFFEYKFEVTTPSANGFFVGKSHYKHIDGKDGVAIIDFDMEITIRTNFVSGVRGVITDPDIIAMVEKKRKEHEAKYNIIFVIRKPY